MMTQTLNRSTPPNVLHSTQGQILFSWIRSGVYDLSLCTASQRRRFIGRIERYSSGQWAVTHIERTAIASQLFDHYGEAAAYLAKTPALPELDHSDQSSPYYLTSREDLLGRLYLVWDTTNICIGTFCRSLDRDTWLINPRARAERGEFKSEIEAQQALIKIWEERCCH